MLTCPLGLEIPAIKSDQSRGASNLPGKTCTLCAKGIMPQPSVIEVEIPTVVGVKGRINMQKNTLDGLRVAILVTDDFEQVELTEPKKALEQAGATTKIISPKSGQIQGMNHDVKADTFPVDMTMTQANPNDFDAVLLPGGALNAESLRMVPAAQQFVRQIDGQVKPIDVL